MTERLTPLDATFLELEEADESAHMHIGGLLVFEPLPEGGAPDLDDVRVHLEGRLAALPRYRQRLSEPHTGGLQWPAWEGDEEFDIDAHVHRAALPAPGSEDELMEWIADYWAHRLDRRRPLWDVVLLEGPGLPVIRVLDGEGFVARGEGDHRTRRRHGGRLPAEGEDGAAEREEGRNPDRAVDDTFRHAVTLLSITAVTSSGTGATL